MPLIIAQYLKPMNTFNFNCNNNNTFYIMISKHYIVKNLSPLSTLHSPFSLLPSPYTPYGAILVKHLGVIPTFSQFS